VATAPSTRSLHDALPIYRPGGSPARCWPKAPGWAPRRVAWAAAARTCSALFSQPVVVRSFVDVFEKISRQVALAGVGQHGQNARSEEHTSELQSRFDLVC